MRKVGGELIGEFFAGVVLVREQFLDEGAAAEEIEGAAVVGEALLERGQMQDLIVAGVLAEVGAADDLIAGLEVHERVGHLESAARERLEELVADFRDRPRMSKAQAPMSKQIPNLNVQATSLRVFGFWSLGFPGTLVFGDWDFSLQSRTLPNSRRFQTATWMV